MRSKLKKIIKFSLLHKQEQAHEESIWSVAWGRIKDFRSRVLSIDNEYQFGEEKVKDTYTDYVVTGSLDDYVKVWNCVDDKLQLLHQLSGHSLGVVSVDISSDGKSKFLVD